MCAVHRAPEKVPDVKLATETRPVLNAKTQTTSFVLASTRPPPRERIAAET